MTSSTSHLPTSPAIASSSVQTDFPKAFLSVSRDEFYGQDAEHQPLALTIKVRQSDNTYTNGTLPADMQGHVFIVGPAGSIASPVVTPEDDPAIALPSTENAVLPSKDGWTGLFNGDGMVYRLDFHKTQGHDTPGHAQLVTRFVKPAPFFADKLTFEANDARLRFKNLGMTRTSPVLGYCSQINTAFQPLTFAGEAHQRLLVTNDANRMYEIDPASLKTLAPIGSNREWLMMVRGINEVPFPSILSSAHPCFDPHQNGGELFTTNVVRSLESALSIALVLKHGGRQLLMKLSKYRWLKGILKPILHGTDWAVTKAVQIGTWLGINGADETYVVRWNGKAPLQRWQVMTPDGKPVKIRQTTHMLGITQNYLLLADTGVKLGPEGLIPGEFANQFMKDFDQFDEEDVAEALLTLLRTYLTYPQAEDTYFYIINRQQFNQTPSGGKVTATPVKIDGPIYHYTTEYDETPDGHIVIHAGVTHATDPGEFIHANDLALDGKPAETQKVRQIAGALPAGLDVNSPAEIVIDPRTGRSLKVELNLHDSIHKTLYLGLYTFRDEGPSRRVEDVFWLGGGAWKELLTEFIYDLYREHKSRRIPLSELMRLVDTGARVTLSRVHIDRTLLPNPNAPTQAARSLEKLLTIPDHFDFPENYIAGSPQFIPKANSTGPTDGYVVCTVIHSNHFLAQTGPNSDPTWSDKTELWIFEADQLAAGPKYKLSHPKLNIGLTIHTTWLKEVHPQPQNPYNIRKDFQELVAQAIAKHPDLGPQIERLFDEIYAQFEHQQAS
ncbi:MAG TPA: carotenoid oxygenase family protein [Crinalium sp.]